MTPLIEHLDTDATTRLADRLSKEREAARVELEVRTKRRIELLQDMKNRERYMKVLEKLSGVPSRAHHHASEIPKPGERTDALAAPRQPHQFKTEECLDGLDLTHISHPGVIEVLHAKHHV